MYIYMYVYIYTHMCTYIYMYVCIADHKDPAVHAEEDVSCTARTKPSWWPVHV